jgi:hypothetical protein
VKGSREAVLAHIKIPSQHLTVWPEKTSDIISRASVFSGRDSNWRLSVHEQWRGSCRAQVVSQWCGSMPRCNGCIQKADRLSLVVRSSQGKRIIQTVTLIHRFSSVPIFPPCTLQVPKFIAAAIYHIGICRKE